MSDAYFTTVTRRSLLTGKVHSLELPVRAEEIAAYFAGTRNIQDVFPELTPQQREFIMSGITPEEWEQYVSIGEGD